MCLSFVSHYSCFALHGLVCDIQDGLTTIATKKSKNAQLNENLASWLLNFTVHGQVFLDLKAKNNVHSSVIYHVCIRNFLPVSIIGFLEVKQRCMI